MILPEAIITLMQPTLPRHLALHIRSLRYAYLLAYYTTIFIINSTSHYIGDVMLVVNPREWFGLGSQTRCCMSVMRVCLGCVESEGCVDRAGITTSLGRVLTCGATWELGYGIPMAGKW